ncbi:TPA: hypothetical protein ACQVH3_004684 [Serratia marcescens]
MNQAEFARHHGVSRKTVTMWKAQGLLVFKDGELDFEASNERLIKHRNTVTHEPKKKDVTQHRVKGNSAKPKKAGGNTSAGVSRSPGNADRQRSKRPVVVNDADRDPAFAFDGVMPEDLMSYNDARTLKENYLALMAKQDFEKKENNLVEMELAKDVLFSVFRQQRDAWLNWPSRVAPLIAADFNVPADRMTEVLSEYVHQHITQLGNPEFIPHET